MKVKKIVFAAFCLAMAYGCSTDDAIEERTTHLLMIGNSFSASCMSQLPQIAEDRGVELDVVSLMIPGCTLKRHAENLKSEKKSYVMKRSRRGKFTEDRVNLADALKLAKWDVVVIQQASFNSWQPKTYSPYGEKLIAAIREEEPETKIVLQQTWSYTPWDKRLARWGFNQDEMFRRIESANNEFAARNGLEVIEMGRAVQEWRRRLPVEYGECSLGGDVVGGGYQDESDHFKRTLDNKWETNCDVFHLNRKGEYFQALVWAAKLFHIDLEESEYRPEFVSEEEARLMKVIAAEIASCD